MRRIMFAKYRYYTIILYLLYHFQTKRGGGGGGGQIFYTKTVKLQNAYESC